MFRLLQKKWTSLFRRADLRAKGQKPPSRGKHWKAKQSLDEKEQEEDEGEFEIPGDLKTATQFVDTESDIPSVSFSTIL